jgi:hypothetical protein
MVNTNYHKSINKTLISRNYFDDFFGRLLLGNSHSEHPGFAIGILKGFGKNITNTWNIWLAINNVIHNTPSIMRSRAWQSEPGCEPPDCDRSDYHRQCLMLADLDVCHCEMLDATIIETPEAHNEILRRKWIWILTRFIKGAWLPLYPFKLLQAIKMLTLSANCSCKVCK